jgi:homoserine dehydrogenase
LSTAAGTALALLSLTRRCPSPPQTNADRSDSVKFGFEAAVCGGIPIIHTLQRDFLGDEITQLSGIINGCTNFILSNMAQGGLSYSDALKEASALG